MKARGVVVLLMLGLCGCGQRKVAEADLYNVQAGLPGGLPYPVMEWGAITSVVDRGAATTSTLFGDEEAVKAARAGRAYPARAVLGLVTWREREDPHWFGARIPGEVVAVEFVVVGSPALDRLFVGSGGREVVGMRAGEILGMRAAVAP